MLDGYSSALLHGAAFSATIIEVVGHNEDHAIVVTADRWESLCSLAASVQPITRRVRLLFLTNIGSGFQFVHLWASVFADGPSTTSPSVSLQGDTETGVVIEIDFKNESQNNPNFCLVGRFLTNKAINFNAMKQTLASMWCPGKGV